MRKLFFIIIPVLILSCTQRDTETIELGNEIDLTEAIRNIQKERKLSELVDSIEFIPLETTPNNLFNRTTSISLTTDYIYHNNSCYQWDGKFVRNIGRRGQGPCEDPGEMITGAIYINNHFYSKGAKFIEYDKNGNCTGKEKLLYLVDRTKPISSFANLSDLSRTGNNLILFNHPDSVYFFNTDFEVVSRYPTTMEWNRPEFAQSIAEDFFTYYNDTVVFYHYFTDTVYHASETTLIPKWVIRLDETDKLSKDYVYDNRELLAESFRFWEQGKLEEARMCKVLDNKYAVLSVYETDKYVCMMCVQTMFNREFRNLPEGDPPFMVFYDKATGKTTASKKIIDDLCGIDNFSPRGGICNNKMVMAMWPYQLEELIEAQRSSGKKVDERLLKLMESLDIEDNPFLIVAHLKAD